MPSSATHMAIHWSTFQLNLGTFCGMSSVVSVKTKLPKRAQVELKINECRAMPTAVASNRLRRPAAKASTRCFASTRVMPCDGVAAD